MNKVIKYLYYLTLVLLFLPAFAFPLAGRAFRVFFIPLLCFWGMYILFNFKNFVRQICYLYKKTPFKYLIYFIAYLFLSSIFICSFNYRAGINAFVYIIQLSILYILPCYLLSAGIISTKLPIKKFLKIYFVALFSIFVFGLFEFIFGKILHIEPVNIIQQFLANERYFLGDFREMYAHRLCSVFAEPGWLGGFLFLNFPIIYKCCLSKYKIFDNKLYNFIIKKTLIVLAWLNLLLTLSPIWLIFCTLETIFIFKNKIIKFIFSKKIIVYLSILFVFSVLIGAFILSSDTSVKIAQIVRIIDTLTSMISFENFLIVEPSLGSRIVSYITLWHIFKEHLLIGIGLNNAPYYAAEIISKYSIPMTTENFLHYQQALKTGKMSINGSALYDLLAQTGLIGTTLYYIFIYKTKNFVNKIGKNFQPSIIKDFSIGLSLSMFLYPLMTLYDTLITVPYNWFLMGLAVSLCVYYHKMKSGGY